MKTAEKTCVTVECIGESFARGMCKKCYRKWHYHQNPEKYRAHARAAYDPEKARIRHEAKKSDPAYLAMRKAAYDRWRAENPDKAKAAYERWRRDNPDRVRASKRRWDLENAEHIRITKRDHHSLRKQRKKGRVVTKADYKLILETLGMVCHICTGEIHGLDDLHFDHVIPLARGGEHVPSNIKPAHAVCNMRKGARIL